MRDSSIRSASTLRVLRRTPTLLAAGLALLLAPGLASAATGDPTAVVGPSTAELHKTCSEFLAAQHIVGMAVAVVDDGQLIFDEGFGEADREAHRKVETSTLFRLGSISKPVAAVIAMQLVDEKKLELDADVRERVPAIAQGFPRLSMRQLLSHTAGIRHYRPDRKDNSTEHRTTAQALELFIHDPLLFEPGAKHSYSTHGYTLVAAALESAGGKSFVELERARIRDHELPALDCEVLSDSKPARSALYDLDPLGVAVHSTPPQDNSWKYAGGGMESTARDLARFGDGVLHARLVSAAGRDALWTRTILDDGQKIGYALGWRVSSNGNEISHTGSQQGAQSALTIVRDQELVIAILTNTNGTKPQELVPLLRKMLAPQPAGAATTK